MSKFFLVDSILQLGIVYHSVLIIFARLYSERYIELESNKKVDYFILLDVLSVLLDINSTIDAPTLEPFDASTLGHM